MDGRWLGAKRTWVFHRPGAPHARFGCLPTSAPERLRTLSQVSSLSDSNAAAVARLPPRPSLRLQLTAQIDTTQQQAAACAAGGAIQPYNANRAPYPVHSWPDAGTNQCKQMQAHANYIQQENTNQITQIQAQEAQIGCA